LSVLDKPAGFNIDYHFGGNQIALVSAGLAGDFDSDGDVDGADFIAWQTHFPTTGGATLAMGDGNGDGNVNGADFALWQTSFPTSPSATAVVPEPSSVSLAGFSALGLCLYARRQRK
jgi:hypothetical protein